MKYLYGMYIYRPELRQVVYMYYGAGFLMGAATVGISWILSL